MSYIFFLPVYCSSKDIPEDKRQALVSLSCSTREEAETHSKFFAGLYDCPESQIKIVELYLSEDKFNEMRGVTTLISLKRAEGILQKNARLVPDEPMPDSDSRGFTP